MGMEFCARSIKPLEGSRTWLRRTRALWRSKTKRQEGGAPAVGEETEVADTHEAFGKNVQQEASQELVDR
jgi:hypothetical protein